MFSHITRVSGCNRALNACFYSAASLKCNCSIMPQIFDIPVFIPRFWYNFFKWATTSIYLLLLRVTRSVSASSLLSRSILTPCWPAIRALHLHFSQQSQYAVGEVLFSLKLLTKPFKLHLLSIYMNKFLIGVSSTNQLKTVIHIKQNMTLKLRWPIFITFLNIFDTE